jgi:broad specificity phosphatase PhoE
VERLILIRHAQSEHQIRGLTGGWTDTPLTRAGCAQAAALAERCRNLLAGGPVPRVYSSDLRRAAQTAGCVAAALQTKCRLEPALREINNGAAAGRTTEEALEVELPLTEPVLDWIAYPGAESWRSMETRVFAAMTRIAQECPTTAVVVTHGHPGVVVIQWWLRLDERCRRGISFELAPGSITELAINAWRERTVLRLNDVAHLEALTDPGRAPAES